MLMWTALVCCFVALAPNETLAKKEAELTVLGGQDVTGDELQYVVSLFIRPRGSSAGSTCTGSLIADQWILTAAHCLHGTTPATHIVDAYVGTKTAFQGTRISAEKWFNHELFSETNNPLLVFHDIALIKLPYAATRVANTALAKLPASNEAAPPEGSIVVIAGFGIEGEGQLAKPRRYALKKADMKVRGSCANTMPTTSCIKAVFANGRSCNGDSGGPMIYNNKVVGITSTGAVCTSVSGDAEYAQVSRYISWINNKIASN